MHAERVQQECIAKLRQVFTHIVKEETFIEASLVLDVRDPESIWHHESSSGWRNRAGDSLAA